MRFLFFISCLSASVSERVKAILCNQLSGSSDYNIGTISFLDLMGIAMGSFHSKGGLIVLQLCVFFLFRTVASYFLNVFQVINNTIHSW